VNTQTICVANIGPRERRKRMKFGMRWLARGGGVLSVLALAGAPRWSRLGAFIPFLIGSIGVFQAREQTCIALASRGTRNMDDGEEHIGDPEVIQQIRSQVLKIYAKSLAAAILLTGLALVVPSRVRSAGTVRA
jgi:hypothetical protein